MFFRKYIQKEIFFEIRAKWYISRRFHFYFRIYGSSGY